MVKVERKINGLREKINRLKKKGKTIGLVPTMGFLHEAHLALVRKAVRRDDVVVVSIFVNPTQFGEGEDYESYPRDEKRDLELLSNEGVDIAFIPAVEEMYPEEPLTFINVEKLTECMCGKYRPGHFRGVATVVAKLFNIVEPNRAYFGKKDYQQLKVLERMVKDLNFPVEIVPVGTIREPNGLAMSSRNKYLTEEERKVAKELYGSLLKARSAYRNGETSPEQLVEKIKNYLKNFPEIKIEYIEVRNKKNLEELNEIAEPAIIALAAYLGRARLIDHIELN